MTHEPSEADHHSWDRHSPIQARAVRTRDAILTAASRQFDVLGYAETSISTMVAAGDITKGGIYFHFSSKEAIAHQLIADWKRTVSEATTTGSDSTNIEQLTEIFTSLARQVAADTRLRAGMKLTLEPSIDDDAFTHWVDGIHSLVENAITAGELDDRPVVHRLAWNLCAGTVGAAHGHSATPQDIDLATRIDDTVTAHLSAAQRRSSENRSR